jgi:hypothetical protein
VKKPQGGVPEVCVGLIMRTFLPMLCTLQTILSIGCAANRSTSIDIEPRTRPIAVRMTVESAIHVEVSRAFQFHADVSNTTYPTCTWSVNGVAGGNAVFGTVTNDGLYVAPSMVPTPNVVTVMATATADTSKSATATVIIQPKSTVLRSPDFESIQTHPGIDDRVVATSIPSRFSLPARPLRKARHLFFAVCKERI